MKRLAIPLLPLVLAASCGESEPRETVPQERAPDLPPDQLRDVLGELKAKAEALPEPLSDERMAELRDLMETAWIDGRASTRTQALAQRSLVDEEGIELALEAALLHDEAIVRAAAARTLGELGWRPAITKLAVRLRPIGYEMDPTVRCAITLALVRLGILGLVDELSGWMDRAETAQVAGWTAIEALRTCGRDPGDAPSYDELKRGVEALAAEWRATGELPESIELPRGPAGEEPVLEARIADLLVALEGFQLRPVDETRFVLTNTGTLGLPLVRDALHGEHQYLRHHALEIAAGLGPVARGLAPDVLPMLDDPLLGPLAATTLGAIGARDAYDHLLRLLDSESMDHRAAAAAGLGKLGDVRAVDALMSRMRDEDEAMDVRVQAAYGVALLDPGMRYLSGLLERGGFHEPRLRELIDDVRAARRR